jgi:uncharacterized membrane protein
VTERRLDVAAVALTVVGVVMAGYLTSTHYADVAPLCLTSGCETVQQSEYSKLLGLPVALLGLGAYVVIAALVLLRQPVAAAALAFGGFLFALYLLVVQLFVIDAICSWCVANEVVATLLAAVLLLRVSGTDHVREA